MSESGAAGLIPVGRGRRSGALPQIVPLVHLADLPFESAPARIAALRAAPKRSVIRWHLRRAW